MAAVSVLMGTAGERSPRARTLRAQTPIGDPDDDDWEDDDDDEDDEDEDDDEPMEVSPLSRRYGLPVPGPRHSAY